ncbi:MAG: hypothetical protein EA390_13640, partial [Balneolaceae bacterium]
GGALDSFCGAEANGFGNSSPCPSNPSIAGAVGLDFSPLGCLWHGTFAPVRLQADQDKSTKAL